LTRKGRQRVAGFRSARPELSVAIWKRMPVLLLRAIVKGNNFAAY
jgi:hypothetical protein